MSTASSSRAGAASSAALADSASVSPTSLVSFGLSSSSAVMTLTRSLRSFLKGGAALSMALLAEIISWNFVNLSIITNASLSAGTLPTWYFSNASNRSFSAC